jgi:hypothetical protein
MTAGANAFGWIGAQGPRWTLIIALSAAANTLADDAPKPATSLSIPDTAAQTTAEKTIRDAFGNHDKSPRAERAETAVKMLDAAAGMQDQPAALYVLLKKAGALAAGAGDGETALKAASMLGNAFAIDSDELALEWLRKASTAPLSSGAAKKVVDAILAFANAAAARQKFDVALRALAAADTAARAAKDISMHGLVQARTSELKLIETESMRAKSAQATLVKHPDDPEANYVAGRFLCLALEDWSSGLPDLAKGSNAACRQAALAELARPEEAEKQTALGDLWWDLAAKETGRSKAAIQRHAAAWYAKAAADPKVGGLERIKIERRIHSSEMAPDTTIAQTGKWIDLLHLVDPKKHVRAGTWKLENGVLMSGHENGEGIQVPYIPPEEYDYRIVFARNDSGSNVVQYASRGDQEIIWWAGQGNKTFALNDKTVDQTFAGFEKGQKHTSMIKVRRGLVQFFLDDRLILEENNEDKLFEHGLWYRFNDKKLLGVGSLFSPMSFYSIEVREISGPGKTIQ